MTKNIGSRLLHLREDKGKEKQDLATYLDVTARSYARYETGERIPDLETVDRLADYFGCTVDYLLGRGESRLLNIISREEAICYKDITRKGYNGKLAHGLMKEIIDNQSYHERVHLSDNDAVNYVSRERMKALLTSLLTDLG